MTDPTRPPTTAAVQPLGDLYTVQAAAQVPFARSLIAGLIYSTPVLVILLALAANKIVPFWRVGVWIFLLWWSGVMVYWWAREDKTRHRIINTLEWLMQKDLDGDGDIADVVTDTVNVRLVSEDGNHQQYLTLPGMTIDQAGIIAKNLLTGTFTQGGLTGSHGAFSLSQFNTVRDELLRRDWIVWRDPTAHPRGVELTTKGAAVMRELSRQADERLGITPTPELTPLRKAAK